MDSSPLVTEQIEAGARFLTEFQKYAPIQTAFWLKEADEGAWHLYVASEQINDDNFDVAYGEVGRIQQRLQDPWLGFFRVKVRGAEEPLAKAALELRRRYPERSPARVYDTMFGGVDAAEVYIYPSLLATPVASDGPASASVPGR